MRSFLARKNVLRLREKRYQDQLAQWQRQEDDGIAADANAEEEMVFKYKLIYPLNSLVKFVNFDSHHNIFKNTKKNRVCQMAKSRG